MINFFVPRVMIFAMQWTAGMALLYMKRTGLLSKFATTDLSSLSLFFFSVVLLDLSMPVLDGTSQNVRHSHCFSDSPYCAGVAATAEIRHIESVRLEGHDPTQDNAHPTRILALTGMSSLEDKRRAFEAGVDG